MFTSHNLNPSMLSPESIDSNVIYLVRALTLNNKNSTSKLTHIQPYNISNASIFITTKFPMNLIKLINFSNNTDKSNSLTFANCHHLEMHYGRIKLILT